MVMVESAIRKSPPRSDSGGIQIKQLIRGCPLNGGGGQLLEARGDHYERKLAFLTVSLILCDPGTGRKCSVGGLLCHP